MTGIPLPRSAFIGFDHLFNQLDRITSHVKDTYPPHNVVNLDNKSYTVELAVAGFTDADITIELKDNILTVTGDRAPRRPEEQYVHRGISTRKFVKSFRLSEYTEVTGAALRDGILSVNLEVKLPEENTAKLIRITK